MAFRRGLGLASTSIKIKKGRPGGSPLLFSLTGLGVGVWFFCKWNRARGRLAPSPKLCRRRGDPGAGLGIRKCGVQSPEASLHLGGLNNGYRLLRDIRTPVAGGGGHRFDFIHHFLAFDNLAEHRVTPSLGGLGGVVEKGVVDRADEELGRGRIRVAGSGPWRRCRRRWSGRCRLRF